MGAPVGEVGDFLRPFEDPIEVVERNEMEADGTTYPDGMIPSRDLEHDVMILVNTIKPVKPTQFTAEHQH